jgi:hypothetical protein
MCMLVLLTIAEILLNVALKHQKSINQLNRRLALSSHHERMVNSRKACRSKKKINNLDSWSYGHDERSSTCGCESSAPFFVIYKARREPTPYW